MTDNNIGQILQAFNSIESKIKEQNGVLRDLKAKVNSLESQNKQLVQMMHQLQSSNSGSADSAGHNQNEFQTMVTQRLRSLEDNSKKAVELLKENGGKAKKRAWP